MKENNPISELIAKGTIKETPDMKIVSRAGYVEIGYNLLADPINIDKAVEFMATLESDLNAQSSSHGKKIKLTKTLAKIKLEEVAKDFSFPKKSLELAKRAL